MRVKQTKICFPDFISTAVRWVIKTLKLGNKVMIGHQKTNLKETRYHNDSNHSFSCFIVYVYIWKSFGQCTSLTRCTSNTR